MYMCRGFPKNLREKNPKCFSGPNYTFSCKISIMDVGFLHNIWTIQSILKTNFESVYLWVNFCFKNTIHFRELLLTQSFSSSSKYIDMAVDLIVIHLSCSSLRVSVNRVSPALEPAIIPALDTRESVSVDFPWSTWAMTDMLRIFFFLSIMTRISSTVKFT